jgi:hypothetical protein
VEMPLQSHSYIQGLHAGQLSVHFLPVADFVNLNGAADGCNEPSNLDPMLHCRKDLALVDNMRANTSFLVNLWKPSWGRTLSLKMV